MIITTKELTSAIKALIKEKNLDEVLDIILPELTEIQLQTIIQLILDPTYKEKEAALTNPNRFKTVGEVVKASIKLTKPVDTVTMDDIEVLTFNPAKLESPPKDIKALREQIANPKITDEEAEKVEILKETLLSQDGILPKEE